MAFEAKVKLGGPPRQAPSVRDPNPLNSARAGRAGEDEPAESEAVAELRNDNRIGKTKLPHSPVRRLAAGSSKEPEDVPAARTQELAAPEEEVVAVDFAVTVTHPRLQEDDQGFCQFCGLESEELTNEVRCQRHHRLHWFVRRREALDLHYFTACPALTSCKNCEEIVEVSSCCYKCAIAQADYQIRTNTCQL